LIKPKIDTSVTGSRIFKAMEGTLYGANVLVVEDGLFNQELFRDILEFAGASVEVVGDGEVAVEEALKNEYDVIFMDMQLPIKDGYKATAELRAKGYQGAIVALTAHAMKGEKERCLKLGCDDYRSKPVPAEKLVELVKKWRKKNK